MRTNRIWKMVVCLFALLPLWAVSAQAQQHWQMDYHQYRYDMTVYFMPVDEEGSPVDNPGNYEVAAFVGDECRGVGTIRTETLGDGRTVTYGYMRVYSNSDSDETVSFRYYKKDSSEEGTVADTTLTFENNGVTGLPSSPFGLVVTTFVPTDPNQDGSIDIFDALAIVDYYLNGTTEGLDLDAADFNHDGVVDMFDAVAIVEYYLAQ